MLCICPKARSPSKKLQRKSKYYQKEYIRCIPYTYIVYNMLHYYNHGINTFSYINSLGNGHSQPHSLSHTHTHTHIDYIKSIYTTYIQRHPSIYPYNLFVRTHVWLVVFLILFLFSSFFEIYFTSFEKKQTAFNNRHALLSFQKQK